MRLKKVINGFFRLSLDTVAIGLTTLLLFEISYRVYLIDFYRGSFKLLNDQFEPKEGANELVIIGDSFSSFKDGYGKVLYDSLANYNVNNMSIVGTSVREQYLFGRHHIRRIKPDILIFQFYTGNDLLGWNHNPDWKKNSVIRNSYWWLSERIWSLGYVNYQLARVSINNVSSEEAIKEWESRPFSPELFNNRDKLYFKSEPFLVENTALLKDGREQDLESYMNRMTRLFSHLPDTSTVYVLIIPHAAELNKENMEKFKRLGAVFTEEFVPGLSDTPLFNEMVNFFSSDSRVTVLNPLEVLAQVEKTGKGVYFNNDSHLNKLGQSVVGEFLLSQLDLSK